MSEGGYGGVTLIFLIWIVLMIVGVISGWDLSAGGAFIAALVLTGIGWVAWQVVEWVRDRHRRRSMRKVYGNVK